MKIMYNLLKFFGKFFVHIGCFLQCFFASFVYTSVILNTVLLIWSFVAKFPNIIVCYYWVILLLANLPLTLVFFVASEIGAVKKNKKEEVITKISKNTEKILQENNNKQDNK